MIVVKNGKVIDPSQGIDEIRDIYIEGAVIKAIDKPGSFDQVDATFLDARDSWVMPGLVDLHVHFREPGQEWKETIATGSEAAVLGGYTSVCCMPNTVPSNHSAESTEYVLDKAKKAGLARVYPIGAVSIDLMGKDLSPLSELHKAGCVAFSDDGEPVYDAGLMRRALEWCLMLDVPISCHEEDKSLSCGGCMNESALSTRLGLHGMPTIAEDVMVARDIELARYTGGRVHFCHISTARGVELIRRAKADGIRVTAEVTPHHLLLTEELVTSYDPGYKMSPPLREEEDRQALVAGLADGTLDAVASDHAPHEIDSKQIEFSAAAFGILGLQTSLPVVLELVRDGKLSISRAVEVMSVLPAKAFSLPGGTLKPGSPADLIVVDPEERWVFEAQDIASLGSNTPFVGREFQGKPRTVIVDGVVLVDDCQLVSRRAN